MRIHINRILCTTDFSDFSNQTIPHGIALAKAFDAELFVCHIIDLPFAAMNGEVQIDPIEQQSRMMDYAREHLSRLFEQEQIRWAPVVAIGHTADEIARTVEKKRIDITISATHGRSGLKRLLLGSVTERLMHTISCPLLIIGGRQVGTLNKQREHVPPRRVLVGCDFSQDSDLAFQYSLAMAQEFEAELHLVHVVEPPVYQNVLAAATPADESLGMSVMEQLREQLEAMVPEETRNWCDLTITLREGKPDEELIRYAAAKEIDLIVLGVRGHGLVEKLFIGSTTDRVARSAPCPVLSVKPVEKQRG